MNSTHDMIVFKNCSFMGKHRNWKFRKWGGSEVLKVVIKKRGGSLLIREIKKLPNYITLS